VPNLKLYRNAWIVAVIIGVLALFTLRSPGAPPLSNQPTSFDGVQAYNDLKTIAQRFPQRFAGSGQDNRAALWLEQTLQGLNLQPHIDSFTGVIDGRSVAMQNVWALSKGPTEGIIVIAANRDSPPLDTQGADNNASGVAVALELARIFTVTAHNHSILFLWTDGDAYGALGARDFVQRHGDLPIIATVALRDVGLQDARSVSLDGWSASQRLAPPWLWDLARRAGRAGAGLPTPLPNIFTQLIRLAVPSGSGTQGPFVAAGIPAITLRAGGPLPPPQLDIVANVSTETVTRLGRAAQTLISSLDQAPTAGPPSGPGVFFSSYRALGGGVVELALVALFLPLALVTLDLFAQARRRKARLREAWLHYAVRFAPWLATLLVVWAAAELSLLPHSPGAVIPSDSLISHHPRYFRVAALIVFLLVAYRYATVVERRRLRLHGVPREDIIFVAHATLLGIAFVTLLVNPFSLLLVLPAAILWPLARAGGWHRSLVPVWLGLIDVVIVLVYFATRLGLGLSAWWYFFLLAENRTVPPLATFVGLAFLAATLLLAHALYVPQRRLLGAATNDSRTADPESLPPNGTGGPAAGSRYTRWLPAHRRPRRRPRPGQADAGAPGRVEAAGRPVLRRETRPLDASEPSLSEIARSLRRTLRHRRSGQAADTDLNPSSNDAQEHFAPRHRPPRDNEPGDS